MPVSAKPKAPPSGAPALDRGLVILEWMASREGLVTFSELRRELDLNSASMTRLLRVLATRGYVRKGDAGYQAGPALERLRGTVDPVERLRTASRPFLDGLRDATGCTALALWWSGRHCLSLAKAVHPDAPSMQPLDQVNERLLGAPWVELGLSFLSHGERADLAVVHGEPGRKVEAAVKRVRRQWEANGWTEDGGAYRPDIRRLAAPVWDGAGRPFGMLALAGTTADLGGTSLPAVGSRLRLAAASLSRRFGGTEPDADQTQT